MTGEVVLSVHPWVGGTRAAGYWGPLTLHRTISGPSWEEGIDEILEAAADSARSRGMNAVVGIEIECDPYHADGGHICLTGTLALLEPFMANVPVSAS